MGWLRMKKRIILKDDPFLLFLVEAVFSVELINTSAGVYQFLLASVERMAFGANLNGDVLLGRAGVINSTASAANRSLLVIRMNSLFHNSNLLRRLP